MSSSIVNHGSVEMEGLMGQYGSESVRACAVQAIATHKRSWHEASVRRGRMRFRAAAEPMLLPMPRPIRNAGRISENVYTVAPKSSESIRVQMTSAPSAVIPERAITT